MLIGKADKEKKQILMHMMPTPQEVLDAAERWQQGVRGNLPTVKLPFPPKEKGQKAVEGQPLPPYPTAWCVCSHRNGSAAVRLR